MNGGRHDSFLILRFENIEILKNKSSIYFDEASLLFPIPSPYLPYFLMILDLVQYLQRSTPIVVSVYFNQGPVLATWSWRTACSVTVDRIIPSPKVLLVRLG